MVHMSHVLPRFSISFTPLRICLHGIQPNFTAPSYDSPRVSSHSPSGRYRGLISLVGRADQRQRQAGSARLASFLPALGPPAKVLTQDRREQKWEGARPSQLDSLSSLHLALFSTPHCRPWAAEARREARVLWRQAPRRIPPRCRPLGQTPTPAAQAKHVPFATHTEGDSEAPGSMCARRTPPSMQ